jgi:hypothetical protein
MNHCGISLDLSCEGAIDSREVRIRIARPVRKAVNGSSVTEGNGNPLLFLDEPFHLSLYVIDGALGCSTGWLARMSGEASPEHNPCGFGQDRNMLTEHPTGHFEHGSLSTARAARQRNELGGVLAELTGTVEGTNE